mgnify:CR=1 FL=1
MGKRMPIKATRALLASALDGSLLKADMRMDPWFGFAVPTHCAGVDSQILNPRSTWADASAYDAQAAKLAQMFVKNFAKFEAHVGEEVLAAAPQMAVAAE